MKSFKYAYEGTEKSLEYCISICLATVLALCATDIAERTAIKLVIFAAAFAAVTLLFFLVRKLLLFILRIIKRKALYNDILHLLVYGMVLLFLSYEYYNVPFWYLPCIAFVASFAMIKLSKSAYALFRFKRKSIRLYVTFGLAAVFNVFMLVFLAGEGFRDEYPALESLYAESTALKGGVLKTAHVDYGNDEELVSETADLSVFVGYSGLVKFVRENFFEYDISKAELKGRVWYPEEGENYPVMFIVHGNHMMTTDSWLGYDYLGEYLASHGYVVVSVDEKMLNGYVNGGVYGENDARAVLLLENVKQLQSFNNDEECVLYNKMDFENICLAGHSRGGEAAAAAVLFNEYTSYPDNSNVSFLYNFNIKSVIAIAPVCDQYMPAGQDLELTDVSYLLIHGSNDQDVNVMEGEKQYENVVFSGDKDCFKAYIYVVGANHGQFNSRWGRYDKGFPNRLLLNTANLLEEEEQQEILKVSVKNFLDATLKQEDRKDFFIDCTEAGLPETIYIQAYEESGSVKIADFEEDADTLTGTLENTSLNAGGLTLFGGMAMGFSVGTDDRDRDVLHLMWHETNGAEPDFQVSIAGGIDICEFLSFELLDLNENAAFEDNYEQPKIEIDLYDRRYNKATVKVSDYVKLYPCIPVRQFKLQYLTGTYDIKKYFQTVYIPEEAFAQANAELDLENITKIIFRFDGSRSGNIAVDNIRTSGN